MHFHTFMLLPFEPMSLLASTRNGFLQFTDAVCKEEFLLSGRRHSVLTDVVAAVIPCRVSSGHPWLYRLLSRPSFQTEFRLFNLSSCERRTLNLLCYFLYAFFTPVLPAKLMIAGLKWRYICESVWVQVKKVMPKWALSKLKPQEDQTNLYGDPRGW